MNDSLLLKPLVGVGVIVIRDAMILLGKRKNAHGEGSWSFPGGHLNWQESIAECAKREVKEETNLTITNLYYGPYTNDIFLPENKHYLTAFVLADAEYGTPKIMEPEKCTEWRWVKWEQMPQPLFLPIQNLQKINFSPFRWSGSRIK